MPTAQRPDVGRRTHLVAHEELEHVATAGVFHGDAQVSRRQEDLLELQDAVYRARTATHHISERSYNNFTNPGKVESLFSGSAQAPHAQDPTCILYAHEDGGNHRWGNALQQEEGHHQDVVGVTAD
jgi:hypothetical protein